MLSSALNIMTGTCWCCGQKWSHFFFFPDKPAHFVFSKLDSLLSNQSVREQPIDLFFNYLNITVLINRFLKKIFREWIVNTFFRVRWHFFQQKLSSIYRLRNYGKNIVTGWWLPWFRERQWRWKDRVLVPHPAKSADQNVFTTRLGAAKTVQPWATSRSSLSN